MNALGILVSYCVVITLKVKILSDLLSILTQVCGTDGETYSNVCELEAQSSNVRVDYRGECMETSSSDVLVDKCQRVRASGRCADVSDCKTVIPSRDGCCRICGELLISLCILCTWRNRNLIDKLEKTANFILLFYSCIMLWLSKIVIYQFQYSYRNKVNQIYIVWVKCSAKYI